MSRPRIARGDTLLRAAGEDAGMRQGRFRGLRSRRGNPRGAISSGYRSETSYSDQSCQPLPSRRLAARERLEQIDILRGENLRKGGFEKTGGSHSVVDPMSRIYLDFDDTKQVCKLGYSMRFATHL